MMARPAREGPLQSVLSAIRAGQAAAIRDAVGAFAAASWQTIRIPLTTGGRVAIKPTAENAERARRDAKDMFARDRAKEAEVVKERERMFAVQTQKTDRLRALRLDRETGERAAAVPAAKPARKSAKSKAQGSP
jgi:hypothetical protein